MKTTIKWLEEYLDKKVLPCPEGNDYVYGMNVAHQNLIHYLIPYLLEKEKEQIINAYKSGVKLIAGDIDDASNYYYNETYNQNK